MKWKNPFKKNKSTSLTECLNCGNALHPDMQYCSSCGQKATISKIGFGALLGTFIATVLNIESGLWRTLGGLFRPGYLSKRYMEGKRKKYLHPMRLFFITLVVQFGLFGLLLQVDQMDTIETNTVISTTRSDIYQDYIHATDTLGIDTIISNSIAQAVFPNVKESGNDSLSIDVSIPFIDGDKIKFLRRDVYQLPIDSIYTKYNINGIGNKLFVRQGIRTMRNLSGSIKSIFGNVIWGVITTLFIIAWIMKLLYIRKRSLYVEHAVVMSHIHSFAFLVGSAIVAFCWIANSSESTILSLIGIYYSILAIYIIWTFAVYYKQNLLKTLIKLFVLSIIYVTVFSISVLFVLLLSLIFV